MAPLPRRRIQKRTAIKHHEPHYSVWAKSLTPRDRIEQAAELRDIRKKKQGAQWKDDRRATSKIPRWFRVMFEYRNQTYEELLALKKGLILSTIEHKINIHRKVSVLDVGCGRGVFLSQLKKRFGKSIHTVGLKLDREKVNKGVDELHTGPVEKYVFPKQFDFIFSAVSLQYCSNPKLAIENIYNSLKDGGKAFIQIPGVKKRTSKDSFPEDFHHNNYIELRKLGIVPEHPVQTRHDVKVGYEYSVLYLRRVDKQKLKIVNGKYVLE